MKKNKLGERVESNGYRGTILGREVSKELSEEITV